LELGYTVSEVNPLIIKRYSQMKMLRAKTDKVDARIIAEFGFEQNPRPSKLPPDEQLKIAERVKAINSFQKLSLMISNRVHALEKSGLNDKLVIREFKLAIKSNKRSIARLENQIKELIREYFQNEYDLLIKISGVGFRSASLIIGFFGNFEDFDNAKQVVSFVGLNPNPRESGSSVRRGSNISKKGNPIFRKILYEAALSASRYNPVCNEMYERLLRKGVYKKKIRVAVAHKLLRQIFAVVKYERDWCPYYHKQHPAFNANETQLVS
jgi:transposase